MGRLRPVTRSSVSKLEEFDRQNSGEAEQEDQPEGLPSALNGSQLESTAFGKTRREEQEDEEPLTDLEDSEGEGERSAPRLEEVTPQDDAPPEQQEQPEGG